MSNEFEPEILSYREFKRREALLAWHRRRRAFEARVGRLGIDRPLGAPSTVLRARERRWSETDGPHR